MNKTTKRIIIVIGILLIILAIALGLRYCNRANASVASSPTYISEVPQQESLETITDEAVPLAGADAPEVIPLVAVETPEDATVPVNAPAAATAAPAAPTPAPQTPTVAPTVAPTATPTATPSGP